MSKVKVAVIGYGHLGKWHCQKANQIGTCEFVAIVESFEAGRKKAQEDFPNVRVVSDFKQIINEVDAFVVVTPTSTHANIVVELLKNKKHVFCEKPLCSNAQELIDIKKNLNDNLVLQVGHSERCHQAWDLLHESFAKLQGKKIIKFNRFAAFKGRATDVDVVQDLMIHDIDLMLYLFKQRPISVKAYGFEIRTNKYDHVVAHFNYSDGSICKITSGRNSTREVRDFEVVSQQGTYHVDLMNNAWSFATHDVFDDGTYVQECKYEKRDHLLLEQEHFYESILFKNPIFVNYEDGAVAVKIIDSVLESIKSDSEVKINE